MRAGLRRRKVLTSMLRPKPELDVEFQNEEAFPGELPPNASMHKWMLAACERKTAVVVRFVDAEEGKLLNSTYRNKDYATNVLTFDYARAPVVTADLVICVPVLEHLAHLLIHGILHAHGYDHLEEAQAEAMEARETEIMMQLGFANPYSDRNGMVHD